MKTHKMTKKSKASTGQIITSLASPDPNIDIRLSILERKMNRLIETLEKKND